MSESRIWQVFRENKLALAGALTLIVVCIAAALAPFFAPFSFEVQDLNRVLLPPNRINWFGTDELGRDVFSRVVYGARVSMTVGLLTSTLALLAGTFYGGFAGYKGGWVDSLMMRLIDFFQSFPHLVLLILISVVFNAFVTLNDEMLRAMLGITFALSLIGWVNVARLVRNQVLQVKEMPYVQAGRASGATGPELFLRHLLPNITGPLLVMYTYLIPTQILYESFLSFIGLGLQPPYSSWGVLANEGWRSFRTYPHLIVFPGMAIFVTMLACHFCGDGLRDVFDPHAHPGSAR